MIWLRNFGVVVLTLAAVFLANDRFGWPGIVLVLILLAGYILLRWNDV